MNSQYIRLADVLTEMDRLDGNGNPVSFDIKFVTADRKRDTAGEIITIEGARKGIDVRNGQEVIDRRSTGSSSEASASRNPHHWENSTRNLLLKNGGIRKVHIRLIIGFNGKKVCF